MDFELSEDQEALVDGVRSLLEGRFGIGDVRAMIDDGLDRSRWAELGATGVFALPLPETAGGVGLGWADAVLVFEQLGRFLVPGPTVATAVCAGLVEGAASGDVVVGAVERRAGEALVEHAADLDHLVIHDDEGLWLVDPSSLAADLAPRPLDPLTPVGHVRAGLPRGERIGDAAASLDLQRRGAVLTSAIQLGLAGGATDLAVAYAKDREQFGKPIGSFQAVKHICADMLGRLEVCRAAVYMAGVTLDDPEVGDPDRALSVARILADHTSSANGKDCVQVHGGMGYTWEVDAHLYLKRAWVLEPAFGSADHHAEWMADATLA
ncbi:MAG: acyl-CoA dehydrogenase family protein [Actinomycetota bacterium]